MVQAYGKRFLRIIENHQRGYEGLMQEKEDRPLDPNHQNVIDLTSDDDKTGSEDFGDDGVLDEYDGGEDDLAGDGEQSRFFNHDPDVAAFNAKG